MKIVVIMRTTKTCECVKSVRDKNQNGSKTIGKQREDRKLKGYSFKTSGASVSLKIQECVH